ncbi:MAG TPA: PilX N-terminal domain-containing pilus assembly protein [Candidatus Methylomirabilis sp.]|nr:PilX N-terminal domain-containing pilus assembly protein [Candidatus Methylomirabilis sp.]
MQQLRNHSRGSNGAPGIALILTLLVLGLMLVMGMTLINLAGSDYQISSNESRSVQALFNADAGLEEAKMRLSPNAPTTMSIAVNNAATDWRAYILSGQTQSAIQAGLDSSYALKPDGTAEGTTNYSYVNTVQTGSDTIPWGWARIQHKMNGANIVYWDPVTQSETSVMSQTIGTPPMTVYNPPVLVITAEGIQNGVRRIISAEYRPEVTPPVAPSQIVTDPFSNAVHSKSTVELIGGASTDSYDSRNGAYNVAGNRHENGDVSTDSTAAGVVSLTSGSTVGGDVLCGPGCVTTGAGAAISNNGTITGTLGQEPFVWNLPLPSVPSNLTNLGSVSLSGNTKRDPCSLTLSEGSYWFSSISITGGAKLCVTGQVTIYVTGSINLGGNGVATANNKPPNFLIYGTSTNPTNPTAPGAQTCTDVSIVGNGEFYGAVYAPNADINVSGNGAVFGALAGKTVRINGNGGFHYDEALGTLGENVQTINGANAVTHRYSRYLWREIPF